jgi:bacillithiol system protein YtxJ
MALNRFQNQWHSEKNAQLVFLDLIAFRALSNEMATTLKVEHQSPQVILVINKEVRYFASHTEISAEAVSKLI